jgi:hypothetical protein
MASSDPGNKHVISRELQEGEEVDPEILHHPWLLATAIYVIVTFACDVAFFRNISARQVPDLDNMSLEEKLALCATVRVETGKPFTLLTDEASKSDRLLYKLVRFFQS